MMKPLQIFTATLLLLLAAFTRLDHLATVPYGNAFDTEEAIDALRLAQGYGLRALLYDTAPEPLFRYLLAAWYRLVGGGLFTARVLTALIGVLTIALTYRAARVLLRHHHASAVIAHIGALTAMGVITALIPLIYIHRVTYRAGLLPLAVLATLILLLQARHWRGWVGAGVAAGVGANTYLAGVMVPIWTLVWLLHQMIFRRLSWLYTAQTLLGMLPPLIIWAWFFTYVADFFLRVNIVSGENPHPPLERIFYGYWVMIQGLFVRGQEWELLNAHALPYLNPLLGLLFGVGVLVLLRRIFQPDGALLLSGLALLAVPAVFSSNPTHTLRLGGLYPLLALIGGIGATWLINLTQRRKGAGEESNRLGTRLVVFGLLAVIIGSVLWSSSVYQGFFRDNIGQGFDDLNQRDPNRYYTAANQSATLWLLEQQQPTYVPLSWLNSSFAVLNLTSRAYPNVTTWARYGLEQLPAGQLFTPTYDILHAPFGTQDLLMALLLPDQDTIVILPPNPDGAPFDLSGGAALTDGYGYPFGRVQAWAARPLPAMPPLTAHPADFNGLELLTDSITLTAQAGETHMALLMWRVRETPSTDFFRVLQVINPATYTASGRALDVTPLQYLYPPTRWQPSDIIPDFGLISMAADLTAGAYPLGVSLYASPPGRTSVPVTVPPDADTNLMNFYLFGVLRSPTPPIDQPLPENATPLDAVLGEQAIRLEGYILDRTESVWTLTLYWRALRQTNGVRNVFVHAMRGDTMLAQHDAPPSPPMWAWLAGEQITTTHTLTLPMGETPQQIYVGVYGYPSFARLTVQQDGAAVSDGRISVWVGE